MVFHLSFKRGQAPLTLAREGGVYRPQRACPFSFEGAFDLIINLISDILLVLYKRAFRKEKEVVTFLIKASNWTWL